MQEYKLILLIIIGIILLTQSLVSFIKKRKEKNVYEELKSVKYFSWISSAVLLIFDLLSIDLLFNKNILNGTNMLLLLGVSIILIFFIKHTWTTKELLIFNIQQDSLEKILLEVLGKYELHPRKVEMELDTYIALEGKDAKIKISSGGIMGTFFNLKFMGFSDFYYYREIITDLRETVNERAKKINKIRGFGDLLLSTIFLGFLLWMYLKLGINRRGFW